MSEGNNRSGRRGSTALADAQETTLDRLETTPIEIGGEVVHVGELSLDQVIVVARLLGEATVRMGEKQRAALREVAARTAKGSKAEGQVTQMHANLVAFLELLDRTTVFAAFGAILERDEEWVRKHLKLKATLKVVAALLKHNDLEELRAAFFEVQTRFGPSLGTWLRSSLSSPPTGSANARSAATPSAGSGT